METNLETSFGLRCKMLRDAIGMSQEAFANTIGMDRSYYASIEVGRRNVTLCSMSKIAEGFGVTLSELLEGVGDYGMGRQDMDSVARNRPAR